MKTLLGVDHIGTLTAGASSRGGGAALEGDLIFDPQPPKCLPTALWNVTDDVDHRTSSF
jgi:hypothetical protein